jgi:hypothetical protein
MAGGIGWRLTWQDEQPSDLSEATLQPSKSQRKVAVSAVFPGELAQQSHVSSVSAYWTATGLQCLPNKPRKGGKRGCRYLEQTYMPCIDLSRRMPWNLGTLDNSRSLWNIGPVYICLSTAFSLSQIGGAKSSELTYTCNKEARQAAPKASQHR